MMTTDPNARPATCPRWLHLWAMFTVCATVVLLTLGALVTTRRVGMADPIWPTYPWHLALIEWEEPTPGFLIEHSHRLAGYVVGCCAIVLAAGLWFGQPRRWLGVLGIVCLLAVIAQGLLGGFRVLLHELLGQHLSLIHGFFAQIVFALLVSTAVFTSPAWNRDRATDQRSGRLRRWSLLTAGVILLQLLLGGFVRHTFSTLGQRLHLLGAFAVVMAVVVLVRMVAEEQTSERSVKRAAWLLLGLVAVQVAIGVEAWMSRVVYMSLTGNVLIRTAHFVVGASVFASSVVTALLLNRPFAACGFELGSAKPQAATHVPRELEVVA